MIAKFPLSLSLLTLLLVQVHGEENCDKIGVSLYEEIGCSPIKEKQTDACPSSYNCNHLSNLGDSCYFQRVKYSLKSSIPDNNLSSTCNGGCFCDVGSKFTCASFSCPEDLGGNPLNKTCMRTYTLNTCCSTGQICPPFEKVAECKFEGETYLEGEKFYPKDVCKTCVCQKGFSGKLEAPFCAQINCGVELRHSQEILGNCAPVYQDHKPRCCPSTWVCPTKDDLFTPPKPPQPAASVKTCKFGEKEIKSGQLLTRKNLEQYGEKFDVECECQIPPLLTCLVTKSAHIK